MTDTFDEPKRPTIPVPSNYASEAERRDRLIRRIELQIRLQGGLTSALTNLPTPQLEQLLENMRKR